MPEPSEQGRARSIGIAAALLLCPAIAWVVAFFANHETRGRHGWYIFIAALVLLPAALAALFNAILGRDRRSVLMAAFVAACVSLAGFGAALVVFYVTVLDQLS